MEYLRNRPIVTGYQRPTFFNRALPRLKPQPAHISMMIFKRRKQREQRLELFSELKEHLDDVRREATFEKMLFRTAQTKQTGSLIKPTRGSTLENSLHPSWDKCLEEWGTFSSLLHIQLGNGKAPRKIHTQKSLTLCRQLTRTFPTHPCGRVCLRLRLRLHAAGRRRLTNRVT